jgi:DNA mismatch repair protein MSH5
VGEVFGDELFHLASDIVKIIDFEESKQQSRLIVRPGIVDDLDELKRTYEGLGDFLVWLVFTQGDLALDHCSERRNA